MASEHTRTMARSSTRCFTFSLWKWCFEKVSGDYRWSESPCKWSYWTSTSWRPHSTVLILHWVPFETLGKFDFLFSPQKSAILTSLLWLTSFGPTRRGGLMRVTASHPSYSWNSWWCCPWEVCRLDWQNSCFRRRTVVLMEICHWECLLNGFCMWLALFWRRCLVESKWNFAGRMLCLKDVCIFCRLGWIDEYIAWKLVMWAAAVMMERWLTNS